MRSLPAVWSRWGALLTGSGTTGIVLADLRDPAAILAYPALLELIDFTTPTKLSDPVPGARPAPELARYDRLAAPTDASRAPDDPQTTSAVSVLAEMITGRDGAEQSASQAWRQPWPTPTTPRSAPTASCPATTTPTT